MLDKIWKKFSQPSKLDGKDQILKNPDTHIKQVAIFGFADAQEDSPLYQSVVEVCKKLAEAGITIVDGGGPGVMKAATVGAKLGGGEALGVTFYPKDITNFEGRDKTNLIDKEIKTESYIERTLTLMREGQAYVIFNGGSGTISEFGIAWGLARLYFGHHKPLILYGKFWENIIQTFAENMLIRHEELKVFKIVTSPQEALEAVRFFELELSDNNHHEVPSLTTNGAI